MPNYAPGQVFDLGAIYRNVSQMKNRNALTESQIGSNALNDQLRQRQLDNANFQYGPPTEIMPGVFGQTGPQGKVTGTFQSPKLGRPQQPKVIETATGGTDKEGNSYFVKQQWTPDGAGAGSWVDVGKPYKKKSLVNIAGDTPEAFDEKYHTEMMTNYISNAKGAGEKITKINQAKSILKYASTGNWEPLKLRAAKFFGVDPSTFQNEEVFHTMMGDFVMSRIQETKGSVSEKEMMYFDEISPSLGKSQYANWALLEIHRRGEMRNRDKPRYYNEYRKSGSDEHFDDWYMREKDPFGEFDPLEFQQQYAKDMGIEPDLTTSGGTKIYTDEQYKANKKKWGL